MDYGEILAIILGLYGIGVVICIFSSIELEYSDWKFAKWYYIFLYPIIPFILFIDLIKFINKYLNKNNLKQMNFKILGKAMGFMFLPTLGVLLMLLIGFFDPIEMWNWIKSDSGWAIFTRIIIFILETGLVIYLYFDYLEKEIKENIKTSASTNGTLRKIEYSKYARDMFDDGDISDHYFISYTKDPNLVLIERKPKNKLK